MAVLQVEDLDFVGGALATVNKHGNNYQVTKEGNMYVARSLVGGIALIVAATTGNHPTLWNPSGSKYNLNIKRLELGYVSGANAPTSLCWMVTKRAGAQVATAGAILTATLVDVENAMPGKPSDDSTMWAPAINTFTAAPAFYRPTGISLFTGVAATAVAPFDMHRDYDGDFIIPPDVAISLCAVAATTTALFQAAITYERVHIDE